MIKLFIGLGNPGLEYRYTRHNIGFMALDSFANKHGLDFKDEKKFKGAIATYQNGADKIILLKPLTYMNLSGESVIQVVTYYKIDVENIIVVVDDLDSPTGRVRLRESGSAGGHNGLKSIISHLNTDNFKRIKVGIGRNPNTDAATHVLGKFTATEEAAISEGLDKAVSALEEFACNIKFNKISSKYSTK